MNIIEDIYYEIINQPKLNAPDLDKNFELFCDAIDIGIGSVLSHGNKIVGYYSYKFNTVESKYTTCEKEMYSIIKSLLNFRLFIEYSHIDILTDSRNITFMNDASKRMLRWELLIQEFHY